ncbi:hypothetical protein N7530_001599 [Penicillium desertorum]|uniref:Uncharacterized protein n=1 Tax=Penicillium desertorum TaxID=1303715 RepID=A0A9W9XA90_9EURO|nr:hypothetical protein N7530_001599 [Penicillium desertorum]
MSAPTGIPTYNSAPVNPNKEEEGTHATTSQPEPATAIESLASAPSQPPPAPATTTAAATAPSNPAIYTTAEPNSAPAPAQPGATAAQPTQTATATPTTSPETATSTTQTPPAPQPGAVPSPSTAYTGAAPQTSTIPRPPKAGEAISQPPAQPTQSYTQSYSYNPPLGAQTTLPNSTTSPYSSVYPTQAGSHRPQTLPLHYGAGTGSGGGASSIFPEEEEEGFMGAAKGWLRWSGNKLAEVEKGVWKKINDVHD